jgi:serine/threonine protein kinase
MLPGEVVAERFELLGLAQAGGMGAIWRARDRLSGEPVAIKLQHATCDDQRFLREAALLAELRHPAIVRHVAHGRMPSGELYLAMEWLEGEDLAQRIARGALAADEALAIVRRIADALALLHGRGGLHRDLKPSNLFLEGGRPERAKLLDFGIARAAAVGVTLTGTIMGTPGYTAPEQARGARDVDARADVFALGCVLYECLTGRAAFKGDHPMAVLARILLEEPPRLVEVAPSAPPALDALVARLLAKDPARRPRDAGELRELIDALPPHAGAAGAGPPPPPPHGRREGRTTQGRVAEGGRPVRANRFLRRF